MNFTIIFYLVFQSLFLVSCSITKKENSLPIVTPEVPVKKKVTENVFNKKKLINSIDDNLEFDKLPTLNKLKEAVSIGKNDPFSDSSGIGFSILSGEFKLKGLISVDSEELAMIEYKNESGTVALGAIGSESTTLLPKGVKLHSIDLENQIITLLIKKKLYEVKLTY